MHLLMPGWQDVTQDCKILKSTSGQLDRIFVWTRTERCILLQFSTACSAGTALVEPVVVAALVAPAVARAEGCTCAAATGE